MLRLSRRALLQTAVGGSLLCASVKSPAQQAAASPRGASRSVFGYDTTPDFLAFNPQYARLHAEFSKKLRDAQLALFEQGKKGRQTPCSRQIFLEARWLTYYSALFDQIDDRLKALNAMLARPADPHGWQFQDPVDGSYGHCSQAWFLKLDASCEELEQMAAEGKRPAQPLKFLDKINSPEALRKYLDSALISDVAATGIDRSYELNIAITGLERLILGDIPTSYPFHPKLEQALIDYQDHRWQDPQTGYFGGWFKTKEGLRKTANLSITFHILSYREPDSIKLWPKILATTLAMKDLEFPYGWLEEGQMSNHHNFDVVRIFRLGWRHASRAERSEIQAEIPRMIDFCLKQTFKADGSFKLMDEDTIGSSFALPVHFLAEAGYFSRRRRFWTSQRFPEAKDVARRIADKIRALGLKDPESQKTLRLLESVD